jgi:cytoskeletal protein RodZ
MKNKHNNAGFGVLAALIVIAVLGIVGFAGWYVLVARKTPTNNANVTRASTSEQTKKSANNTTQVTAEEPLSKVFEDPTKLVSLKYPDTWKVDTNTTRLDDNHAIVTTTVTSMQGTVLNVNLDWGGKGGDCVPKDADKPFQKGNDCPTIEYLTSEPTGIKNVYDYIYHRTSTAMEEEFAASNIVLTSKHYADQKGNSQYVIGLVSSNGDNTATVNKPFMGFVTPDDFFTVYDKNKQSKGYVHACASFADEAQLRSKDATTVKNILRSLSLNLPN